jgi:hypothetical protein
MRQMVLRIGQRLSKEPTRFSNGWRSRERKREVKDNVKVFA